MEWRKLTTVVNQLHPTFETCGVMPVHFDAMETGEDPGQGRMETTPMLRNSKSSGISKVLNRNKFDNSDLEQLFKRYIYKLQQSALGYMLGVLILLTATLSALKFVYFSDLTVRAIYLGVQCLIFLGIFIFLKTRFMKESHFRIVCYFVLLFLVLFAVMSFPIRMDPDVEGQIKPVLGPMDGVWEVMFVVFMIYSLMPLRTYIAAIFGLVLPVCHMTVSAVLANHYPEMLWRQVRTIYCLEIASF